nr:MAG TPA: hypothetical protein [Caudoviricetes sp.]
MGQRGSSWVKKKRDKVCIFMSRLVLFPYLKISKH